MAVAAGTYHHENFVDPGGGEPLQTVLDQGGVHQRNQRLRRLNRQWPELGVETAGGKVERTTRKGLPTARKGGREGRKGTTPLSRFNRHSLGYTDPG